MAQGNSRRTFTNEVNRHTPDHVVVKCEHKRVIRCPLPNCADCGVPLHHLPLLPDTIRSTVTA